ncbi:MAG: hypothetical protein ACLFV4_13350 [Candidatus Hydrogenedentota bacterium]
MPCNDVTEHIRVELDDADRLTHYSFLKRTCGAGVGAESLLLPHLRGRSLRELLTYEAGDYTAEYPQDSDIEEFLNLKHLYAVKAAIEVLAGQEPGGPDAEFTVSEIGYSGAGWFIEGLIAVDILTDRITSCGNCKGCGSQRKKKTATS